MGTVQKDVIARSVADATGQTLVATKATIDAFIEAVVHRANAEDTVRLAGFGSFVVKVRAARIARNPATGAPVDVPETRRLTFKPAKSS